MWFFRELKDQLSQEVKEVDNLDTIDKAHVNEKVANDKRSMEDMFSRNGNRNSKNKEFKGNQQNYNEYVNRKRNQVKNDNPRNEARNKNNDEAFSNNNYKNVSSTNVDDEISNIINSIVEMEENAARQESEANDYSTSQVQESNEVNEPEQKEEDSQKELELQKEEEVISQIKAKKDDNDMAGTVITKNTIIAGNISTVDNMEIYGAVRGDVECKGSLSIFGEVAGNATAVNICINTTKFEGDLISEGCVEVAEGTVVIGNITASSALISGAVKGEIDVCGPVILESSAVVKGNIKGKTVKIDDGAILQGFCELSHADKDIDNFFEPELSNLESSNEDESADDEKKKSSSIFLNNDNNKSDEAKSNNARSDIEDIIPFDIKNNLSNMKILGNDDVVAGKNTANKPAESMEKEVDLEVGEMLNKNFEKQFNEINNENDSIG